MQVLFPFGWMAIFLFQKKGAASESLLLQLFLVKEKRLTMRPLQL
jgi:hypothetical protein